MNIVTIPKPKMREILNELSKEKDIAAPVNNGKVVDFLQVRDVNSILMGDEVPYKSPKEFFFPRSEKIIEFGDSKAVMVKPEKGAVIFGARPCDLTALKILKAIFTTGKFSDPFFKERYENALIIGVGCINPKPGCFCDVRETDMKFSAECDLFLENGGDSYNVLFVSDKGREALVRFVPGLDEFENPEAIEAAYDKPQLFLEKETEELFDNINWEKLTNICQGCGLCTYICPTCHCFEFKDVESLGVISRHRNWDSCMYPKFTLHASGHNPRETKAERFRQRVLHKYIYVIKNVGHVACSGCGRCNRSCPAGMNIHKIVSEIGELSE